MEASEAEIGKQLKEALKRREADFSWHASLAYVGMTPRRQPADAGATRIQLLTIDRYCIVCRMAAIGRFHMHSNHRIFSLQRNLVFEARLYRRAIHRYRL